MKNIILLLYLALITNISVADQFWNFPFPAFRGDQEIGEIIAKSDGQTVKSIDVNSLKALLVGIVNDETLNRLSQLPLPTVTFEELKNLGIEAQYDPSQVRINITIATDNNQIYDINFAGNYNSTSYSDVEFWSWRNNFNLSSDYTQFSIDDIQSWEFQWLNLLNIGGVEGVNIDLPLFADGGSNISSDVYRGEFRVFIDKPKYPWRLTLGDTTNTTAGHLPSVSSGGIAFERLYSDLQPTRNIQNGGTQPLVLNETADIEIYINDAFYSEIRLPPGRYSLDDFPLSSGNNDIRLELSYQSGKKDTIIYSQFFNSRLLRTGISDFGIYSGLISSVIDQSFSYDEEQWVTNGFYDYGLSDTLTIGINGLYHPNGQQLGAISTFGTDLGNIALRVSSQNNSFNDDIGSIYSIDYSHQIWGSQNYGSPNLQLSYEYQDNYYGLPWQEDVGETGYRANARYSLSMTYNLTLILNGSFEDFEDQQSRWLGSTELSWVWDGLTITIGVEQEEDLSNGIDEERYLFSLDWDWTSESGDYNSSISYSNEPDSYRAQFEKNIDNYAGSYGYAITTEGNSSNQRYALESDYIGNRFNIEGEVAHNESDNIGPYQTAAVRGSTSLTFTGNSTTWSRPVNGPIAIVKVHETLDSDVEINALADQPAEAISTRVLSNAVSLSAHQASNVFVDSPEAPVGYNIGDYLHEITPGTQTAHLIYVGSEASKTIIGQLYSEDGQPIALKIGQFISGNKTYDLFTNRSGRFVLENMASGLYTINIGKFNSVQVEIPVTNKNLIYLPDIYMEGGPQ
ncbi:pilus assembly protein PapC [Vibrio splendidus]|uniref:pilus assembly protein PapC n=1 Tax=Vibrio splendidus TaxID=29497 RepID=UPI0021B464C4|nr:pilus assembly protein PapC [Vibrio splendidus]UWZ99123.1 pilus assembly protein PapC [Vibrio splendidus]